MTTIVTVHGTNAGQENDAGEQWWQTGSPFQRQLSALVEGADGPVRFHPHHWGVGPNSERARREAGDTLRKTLHDLDKEGEPYAVIGHSHGGSVLLHALFSAYAKKRKLPGLAAWLTVGTPFVETRRSGPIWSRYNLVGQIALLFLAVLAGLFALTTVDLFVDIGARGDAWLERIAPQPWMSETLYASLESIVVTGSRIARSPYQFLWVFGAPSLAILAMVHFYSLRSRKRHSAAHQEKFCAAFFDRWVGLRHADDEAISGLRAARGIRMTLIPYPSVRRAIVGAATLFAALLVASMFALENAPSSDDWIRRGPLGAGASPPGATKACRVHRLAKLDHYALQGLPRFFKDRFKEDGYFAYHWQVYDWCAEDLADPDWFAEVSVLPHESDVAPADLFAPLSLLEAPLVPLVQFNNTWNAGFDIAQDVTGLYEVNFGSADYSGSTIGLLFYYLKAPLAIGLVWLLASGFSAVVARPLVVLANRALSGQVRNVAYGNDALGEGVERVSPLMDRSGARAWPQLPEDVGGPISSYSAAFASETLNRMRRLLGWSAAEAELTGLDRMLSDQLTWKELIHTAYFDVDRFTKLVAVALEDCGLVAASAAFKADPEYLAICALYRRMKDEARGAAETAHASEA